MASRKFLQEQVKRLEINYGKDRFKVSQPMYDLWAEMFKDYDEDGIKVSVDEYIRTNEFPPTIASIMKIYDEKNKRRQELGHYLKTKCNWISRWYEKPMTQKEIEFIKQMVSGKSFGDTKTFLDDMALEAVRFYNESVANGVKDVTIMKFLEGYQWTQKDR